MALLGLGREASDGKRDITKHLNATETAIAEKIRKCQESKGRLDKAILDVDLETQHLTRTLAKLQKLLARRRAALNLSERRLQVRSNRPSRELTNDKVQQNLIQQGTLLHEFIHKIERGMRAVEHNIDKLNKTRAALAADAGDKAEAIRVNRQALSAEAETYRVDDVAARSNANNHDMVTYPYMWAHSTDSGISSAEALVADSQKLRQTLHRTVAEYNDTAVRLSNTLEHSMMDRIELTRKNRRLLEEQLRNITDETARACGQREALRDASKARSGPLLLVRHRALLRRTLPDRELVADEADHALRKEMRALQLHSDNIDAHEAALDAQIRRLDGARAQVEAHLQDKNAGEKIDDSSTPKRGEMDFLGSMHKRRLRIQVDVECALLDGRPVYNRPCSSAASDISSLYSFRPKTAADVSPNVKMGKYTGLQSINETLKKVHRAGDVSGHLGSGTHFDEGGEFRPVTAPTATASSRARQRVEQLEVELQRAREERKQMEASVRSLVHELEP